MSPHPTVISQAPWKKDFESHLEHIGGPSAEFYLATVTPEGQPKVRTCIHRGFWAQLPENKHNELPKNPAIYQSDCPVFTNDARMEKTYHIFATGKGKGNREQSKSGSGGGGPVEAVYWVKDTMTQWRISGKAWILASDDIEGGTDAAQNSGTVTMKAEVGRYMRPVGDHESKNSEWSWKNEVENHFENLSPGMRGTFRNPPPGQPLSTGKGEGEELGQKVGHLAEDELARKNFRVVVITPERVERVDLSDPEKSQRWIYTLAEEFGGPGGNEESKANREWNEVETWP